MAQYLTYDEYVAYGGDMSETDFTIAEFKARSRIDWLTMARVQYMAEIPEEVKLAMMVIIKVDSKFSASAQVESAIISSYSTDGYSETYGSVFEQARLADQQVNREVIKMLLGVMDDSGTPLIYRGVP